MGWGKGEAMLEGVLHDYVWVCTTYLSVLVCLVSLCV